MLYDYFCEKCDHTIIDYYQSIHDEAITLCPSCNSHSLQRCITGGLGSFMKDAKTIGQLADKNWSQLGNYKRSEIETRSREDKLTKSSPFQEFGSATKKEINKMTPQQKKKYIITGEK